MWPKIHRVLVELWMKLAIFCMPIYSRYASDCCVEEAAGSLAFLFSISFS